MERFGETTDNELEPLKPDFDFTAQEVLETYVQQLNILALNILVVPAPTFNQSL